MIIGPRCYGFAMRQMLRKEAQHTAKQINSTQGNWKQEGRRTERRESWGKEGKGRKAGDYSSRVCPVTYFAYVGLTS